jgi:hypothetical protein
LEIDTLFLLFLFFFSFALKVKYNPIPFHSRNITLQLLV